MYLAWGNLVHSMIQVNILNFSMGLKSGRSSIFSFDPIRTDEGSYSRRLLSASNIPY